MKPGETLTLVLYDSAQVGDPVGQLGKGEAVMVCHDGYWKLIFGCPGCGRVALHTKLIFDPATRTFEKSVRCEDCTYHGLLKNGVFTCIPD